MHVAIIGGKLQGVEAAYLAGKAGWRTLLIDKEADVPASGLCDETARLDICNLEAVGELLGGVDLIVPALEDREALSALQRLAENHKYPVAFDAAAYSLSSSKSVSHKLFDKLGLQMPSPFPQCGFPVLVKPDGLSGSQGVAIIDCESDFVKAFGENGLPEGWVGQKYLSGPSYSLEVIGKAGRYLTSQVTELHMDAEFDCKGVTAPARITEELRRSFEQISRKIARAIELKGIMDVEVIWHKGKLYILEIDARLPSQTPVTVYWSCGVNMLEKIREVYLGNFDSAKGSSGRELPVWLEHIEVADDVLTIAGEHLMTGAGPLKVREDFFGAREAITNFEKGRREWSATLIHVERSRETLIGRRQMTLDMIRARCGIRRIVDSHPSVFH